MHISDTNSMCLWDRLSADKTPRLSEPLDAVKFLSKDVWLAVFGKPLDNLKTNHKVSIVIEHPSADGLMQLVIGNICAHR